MGASHAGASLALLALFAMLATACPSAPSGASPPAIRMTFARPDFYAAPFPSDDLRAANGTIALGAFPNPDGVSMVAQALALTARDARGFASTGGVFFSLTAPLPGATLPDLAGSIASDARVFLVGVDAASPDAGRRYPVEVFFETDGGPFGAPNLLSLVPLQGAPLRPSTTYAAVVLRTVATPPLAVSDEMRALARGDAPLGLESPALDTYRRALTALDAAGVARAEIAGLAVFTTDAPIEGMARVRDDILARPLPIPGAFVRGEVFPDYCVYASTIAMPVYQQGTPPYDATGGDWAFDGAGNPVVQKSERANFVVTVPRVPVPAAGYPTTVFVRTGGGGDRPLVDRGPHLVAHGEPPAPGLGPALHFARAGFAGVSVDGPHGGLRNVTHGDEQFLMFNIFNAAALRDNVRQSAIELVLLAHILEKTSFDASDCPGVGAGGAGGATVRFDTGTMAIMGHSMGATIAPLALAFEPRYRAAILSGAGGSWIENVMYKKKPIEVRPAVELFLEYGRDRRALVGHDPVLTLLQWAAEASDTQVYARRILPEPIAGEAPRHVLMLQGIVDHYIMPRIANTLSLALGLDLAGEELDGVTPEIADEPALSSLLRFSGRGAIALPTSGNVAPGKATAVVLQYREDGIEDGHEIAFQLEAPKHQYRCFLASLAGTSAPVVPLAGVVDAPCR